MAEIENPWLRVPADQYEAHMGPDHADQLAPLAAIFGGVYRDVRPARLAILGCATGNGLEHVDPQVTTRATAIDINPAYVEAARARYRSLGPVLDVRCADLLTCELSAGAFDLVHAALIFEHVDDAALVPRIARWLAPGGTCAVVLQVEDTAAPVTPSPYPSIAALAASMRLVSPARLARLFAPHGLTESHSWTVPLPTGRVLEVCLFRR